MRWRALIPFWLRVLLIGLALNSAGPIEGQAKEIRLAWPELKADLPLWEPEDSDKPSNGWPAIICYHGTNGKPSIGFMRQMVGGLPVVLVGMAYGQPGRFQQSEGNITKELSQLAKLKQRLVEDFDVDRGRVYVAGFSKGGWMASLLLERDPELAGGLVLGAGVFHARGSPKPPPMDGKKAIYIGVGRDDNNYPQSLRALVHFRQLGAGVTLEAWPERGHERPGRCPEGLRQWLVLQIHGADGRVAIDDREAWIVKERAVIEAMNDPIDRWFAWRRFLEMPFLGVDGFAEARERARAAIKGLEDDAEVAAERRWDEELKDILRKEMQDRYVTTLKEVSRRYHALALEARGTRTGAQAAKDAQRTAKLLGEGH